MSYQRMCGMWMRRIDSNVGWLMWGYQVGMVVGRLVCTWGWHWGGDILCWCVWCTRVSDGDGGCENIPNGYLYDGDLVFVILKGIYGFKFPKRFLEISSRDLTSSWLLLSSFVNPYHLKTWLPTHWYPFPLHSQGWMPCKQQSDILTVYQIHVFAKLHKQNKNWLHLKIFNEH